MVDIKKHAASATAECILRGADDEIMYEKYDANGKGVPGTEVKAIVFGPGTRQWRKAKARTNNRTMDLIKRKGKTEKSEEESIEETAEFLTAVTDRFENLEYGDSGLKGKDLIRQVYSDIEIGFIADQVSAFVGDWANFSKPSAKN